MKIKELLKEINGVFKPPIKKHYFGKIYYGTPYFYPRNFNRNILKIKKLHLTPQEELDKLPNDYVRKNKKFSNLPMVRRSKYWTPKIFNQHYYIEIGYPIAIKRIQLGWKDKYESPRFEWTPSFQVYFFKWQYCNFWNAPDGDDNRYYEQILWYLIYSNKDIKKAEETWGWVNGKTKESTWKKEYLL